MSRVVILGAGVAGLAAAYRLLQLRPGWEVVLAERESEPGGLAATIRRGDFAADLGPHRLFTELPEIERLLPEIVRPDQVANVPRRSELLLEGHFYRYPVRAMELLRYMGPLRVARLGFSAVAGKLWGLRHGPRSFEEAMIRAFGAGAYRLLIESYARKVWKAEPAQLDAEVARVRVSAGGAGRLVKRFLRGGERKGAQTALNRVCSIRGGAEGLVRSLAERVAGAGGSVSTQMDVEGFGWDGARITSVRARESAGLPADCVISTIPITDLVRYLQELAPDEQAASAAGGLEFIGMILVALIVKRPSLTPNNWIYFPEERFVFNRAYEPKNFDPSMAPPGRTMAVFEVTARWGSPLWAKTDAEIAEAVRTDAAATGLVRQDEIEEAFAVRISHTYPLYSTGYADRLETIFGYLRRFPNLISTGRQGLFNHNNMDHSMLMGMRAAEYAAEAPDPAPGWYDGLSQFAHFRIVD